jgi:hypothetical protein
MSTAAARAFILLRDFPGVVSKRFSAYEMQSFALSNYINNAARAILPDGNYFSI